VEQKSQTIPNFEKFNMEEYAKKCWEKSKRESYYKDLINIMIVNYEIFRKLPFFAEI